MSSALSGLPAYGDAPALAGSSGMGFTVVDLPGCSIRLTHPRDALARIYAHTDDGPEPPYWAQPWPSGIELAETVAGEEIAGVRVLELGCGLALPSLVAAQRGARVLATDHVGEALHLASVNAHRNRIRLEVALCDWSDPWSAVAGAPWDLVLAADVLYDDGSARVLAGLLPRLLDRSGEVWIADQGRRPARDFLDACRRWAVVTSTDTGHPDVRLHRIRWRRVSGGAASFDAARARIPPSLSAEAQAGSK